jgi:hypothetical protein
MGPDDPRRRTIPRISAVLAWSWLAAPRSGVAPIVQVAQAIAAAALGTPSADGRLGFPGIQRRARARRQREMPVFSRDARSIVKGDFAAGPPRTWLARTTT